MCFYDHIVYECNDWKWGNMRRQCDKEYRIGETCGARLPYDTVRTNEVCPTCQAIARKQRRLAKAMEDYYRWEHDPRRPASKGKVQREIEDLEKEIRRLEHERAARRNAIGRRR